jgi:hypothetical protein
MPSSFGIEWGRLTLDAISTVILIDFALSSYLMDQSIDRILSRCCHALPSPALLCSVVLSSFLSCIIDSAVLLLYL